MTSTPLFMMTVISSMIVVVGFVDDLRAKKLPDWGFLAVLGLVILIAPVLGGGAALVTVISGITTAAVVLGPLTLLKVLSVRDFKLFLAFGAAMGWNATLDVALLSLAWAVALGLMQVALKGQLMGIWRNMVAIASRAKPSNQLELHRLQFGLALFFGWLTYLIRSKVNA